MPDRQWLKIPELGLEISHRKLLSRVVNTELVAGSRGLVGQDA